MKRIATKLKRQINTLKKDKIIGGQKNNSQRLEEDLDTMIEENFNL